MSDQKNEIFQISDELVDDETGADLNETQLNLENEDDSDDALVLPTSAFTPINFSESSRRIIDLYRSYKTDKELDPRPSFQRGYVWDRKKATKLIESILLHVPLPLVYTAEEGGVEVVIDGQQRLTTCFAFIDGYFPFSKKEEERKKRGESVKHRPFRLSKMKILSHLEKQGYSDLDGSLKKTINNFPIRVIKISKDSHPDVKFEIFERLNTGSVALSDQELRNCIYRGKYNELLCELANNPSFMKMLGINDSAARMQDVELVLRFMAFNSATHLNYNDKMRKFLNDHMRENRNISDELADLYKKAFVQAVESSYTVFGDRAFRRYSEGSSRNPSGKWENSINKAVYDVIMFWFARYPKNKVVESADAIREKFIELCVSDKEFSDAIMLGTADVGRVRTRFSKWGAALESLISGVPDARAFPVSLKSELFDAEPKCGICGQNIHSIDDAEVDHIKPFSLGGATDPSNARLAHRFCNRSRGNRN